ncbi:MAG: chromosomal replication initiator protein DnaA [Deltaproteobacteria bacterium]
MSFSYKEIWDKCLQEIKTRVDEKSFKTWFNPIKPIELKNKILTIRVPNKFFYEWIEDHYIELLGEVLFNQLGEGVGLQYQIVVDDHKDIAGNQKQMLELKMKDNFYFRIFEEDFNTSINKNYTFDNFIEGHCNNLARNAAIAVSKNPGKTAFNPLIIHGGVGLGKTHLLNAIGNQVIANNPGARIIMTNTERFTNQIIKALKDNTIYEFISSFQLVDVFMIDDIQFLEDRTKTQEIFFNIFNYLHQREKQLVITSDKSPAELIGIQERLISRFKWGLVTDLEKPDLETRIKILESKASRDELHLPEEVLNFIGYNVKGSIRDLEGVLVSLSAHSTLNRKKIDMKLTNEIVSKISKHTTREISVENIQNEVCEFFNISLDKLKGKDRHRYITEARQIAIYFSKKMTEHSLKEIGIQFGGKDHTTVLHSIKTVKDLMENDPVFNDNVVKLEHKLENGLIKMSI